MSELTPERWKKIKNIYYQLVDRPPEEWRQTLPQLCAGDQELQRDVQYYLQREIGGFLDSDACRPRISHTEILLRSGEVLAGRYRVVKLLGTGGMADVYEVEDKELKKQVALKLIRSDVSFDDLLLERFRKEVELTHLVKHRNVCAVYDIGHDRRGPRELTFLTMELIPGETMAERIRRNGSLDASEWLPVARQLCNAMQEAHWVSVLHRDFKPGNVMLVGSGANIRAVVTDFGIASAMGGQKGLTSALTAKYLMGTLLYMSPEQERGEELDATSDIYSLGLVLYEMLTGKQYRTSPQLDKIPEHLGKWRNTIQRCLEDDAKLRLGSAAGVLQALEEPAPEPVWNSETIPIPPPTPAPAKAFWRRLWIATACFFLIPATAWGTMNLWKIIFPPLLPKKKIIAIVPFKSLSNDAGMQIRADATSEQLNETLRTLRDEKGSLSIIPWRDVIDLNGENADLAATRLHFNLYLVGTINETNGKEDYTIQLRQLGQNRPLRSRSFSLSDDSQIDKTVLQEVSAMLGLPKPSAPQMPTPRPEYLEALRLYNMGRGYFSHRDIPNINQAIGLFEQATTKDPLFAQAYAYLAFAYSLKYRKTGETPAQGKAMQNYEKAINLNSALPQPHLALGMILQDTGSIGGAIDEFKQALSLAPTDGEAPGLLSIAYLESGNIDEATRLLSEAVQQDSADWSNHNDLGYIYYRTGDLAKAEKEVRRAVELAPDNSIANGVLTSICICMGRYDEAERIANKILDFKRSAMADESLALIYEHRGRYSDAVKMLQDATQRRKNIDSYWMELGDAFTLQGMKSEAIKSYRQALNQTEESLKSNPGDRDLLRRVALYHAKLGQKAQALRQLKQAVAVASSVPNPEFPLFLAQTYELAGRRTEALNVLRPVIRNKCVREAVERIPDFASLRSDRQYLDILNQAGSL